MKIVCSYHNDISTNGLAATLAAVYGDDFKLWMVSTKPIFDIFDEFNPDIFIIHHQHNTDFVKEVLKEYNKTKVIVITDQSSEFTTINPREDLANLVQFGKGEVQDCFKTDVIYWSRNENVTDELLQALDLIYKHHSLKIFGDVRIDMPQYLGVLNARDTAHALTSANVNLDFNNNSLFNAAINNTPSVHFVDTSQNIQKDIATLLDTPPLYKKELTRIRKLVKEKHTFHDKIARAFTKASLSKGMEHLSEEADKVLKDLEKRW